MKLGVILPTFRSGARDAFYAAVAAEAAGLDGVFAYDHLWPIGHRERPSLAPFPLLAAVASEVPRLSLGPLVARVGLVGDDVLLEQYLTLLLVAPDRVIAALGTGDHLSAAENEAFGIAYASAAERRAQLERVAWSLRGRLPLWIGAGTPATNAVAERVGAELNLWGASASEVALVADTRAVNWAGVARDDLEAQLDDLAAAGATWAVLSPSTDVARMGRWIEARGAGK